MITRDYVIRLVSQLARVLQRVLMLKQSHELLAARKELTDAYRSLLGMGPELARSLPEAELIKLLGTDRETQTVRCYVLGVLLKEESELEYLAHRQERADELCARALGLLLTAFVENASFLESDHRSHIERCITSLRGAALPPVLLEKLFRYYGATMQYDKAEDVLFELLPFDEKFRTAGISFFEALLDKSDQEIADGGLTRQEVQEILADIKQGTAQR